VLVIFIQIQGFVKILQVRPFGVVLAIRCSVVTNAAAIASWHTKDTLARGYLISTIESQQQRSLINCNTAHEMWIRLSAQYLRNAVENRYFFYCKRAADPRNRVRFSVLTRVLDLQMRVCHWYKIDTDI
jgi:hypothetical protein